MVPESADCPAPLLPGINVYICRLYNLLNLLTPILTLYLKSTMISSIIALSIAGLVAASPVTRDVKRWTQSSADCWSFYEDIYAEANNTDLQSVIGGA
jgi:hypothetical protein